ncbi:2-hydroxyacid dehydrogenase [Frigidibacter sp. MR17.24]|uniref:2-hydroxyacid dehydrogenase n=1 Tax=Frigidibacter sp. MR17.24 TaxID=3127345 RepID=UPI003012CEF8
MKPDVLVAYPLIAPFMEQVAERYTLHRLDQATDAAARDAVLAKAGPVCRAMIVNGHVTVDAALLDRLPALELAACSSAGFDLMDLPEMTRRGVRLTNTSDALVDDVADMAVLLMLASRRRLVEADAYVRSGEWGRKGMFPLTRASAGRRAGIVGLGNIGQAIARRCAAMGMEIGYSGRTRKEGVPHAYFPTPEALAAWADVLLVATPGGAATAGLISGAVLQALGPDGLLVNISRGTVIDEAALIAALGAGTIAGAGLDVYRNEPNPDPALTGLANVTLYPHHASGTVETRARMAQLTIDNLDAFFAEAPLLTAVN